MWFDIPLPDILANHEALVMFSGGTLFLLIHFWARGRASIVPFSWAIRIIVVLLFVRLWVKPEPVAFSIATGALFLYGITVFIFLCDLMLYKQLAQYLTRKRGTNWTKEMDYLYLGLGALGVLFSVNRINIVTGRFEGTDIIAPLLLTTALVIRLIKTRAEIGNWNKL
jgi:hypothetical protein